MKKFISLLFLSILIHDAKAQCISGNCDNGKGKYDFGWCVYEGNFKNGKAEGEGKMTYDDYTYSGQFKNGLEDGKGIIVYKNGRKEDVVYYEGKKAEGLAKVAKEDWKEFSAKDQNCLEGNCITGFGSYLFSSGNKYVGNFINSKREGQGIFYFSNGEKFEGLFHDNEKSSGTYTFLNGAKYTGTYNSDGLENNGFVTLNVMSVSYVNGKVIIPPRPEISYATGKGEGNAKTPGKKSSICPMCNGRGKKTETSYNGAGHLEKKLNTFRYNSQTTSCSFCSGAGFVSY